MGADRLTTPPCDGCLDTRRCWVCLGRGVLEGPAIQLRPCHRCEGTGRCWLCQITRVVELPHDVELPPDIEITDPVELRLVDPDDADRDLP